MGEGAEAPRQTASTKAGGVMTMVMEPLAPWLRDFNRLFSSGGSTGGFFPLADVIVSEEDVQVYMDMPGVSSDDLQLELENDVLTVRGERPFPYSREDGERISQRIERGFGRFERVLRMPRGLDPNTVEASLADGVLTLRIPKPEPLKPHRIEVAAGGHNGPRTIEGSSS
jgi:HSP20 family protein